MIRNFIGGELTTAMHLKIFKMLLLLCNTAGLLIYSILHFILFDFPFETIEETLILFKLFCAASCVAGGLSLLLLLIDKIDELTKKPMTFQLPHYAKLASAAVIIVAIVLTACNIKSSAGIEKDLNTGLTASYKNLKPKKTMLTMNNEVLNHTDIPLGESFQVINEGVEGLTMKDGKVSAGCSLKITDQAGNVLMDEKDLFAGKDVFDGQTTDQLSCTVSTGKPMAWEEKYNVAVTFWDKYGDGKIDNTVTIRCIDLP